MREGKREGRKFGKEKIRNLGVEWIEDGNDKNEIKCKTKQ